MERATFLLGAAGAAVFPGAATGALARLERRVGGRLGVCAKDTADGRHLAHRSTERFPMCSTFKAAAVAAVLARVDAGTEHLERPIRYGASAVIENAPVTRANLRRGALSVGELCAAAVVYSDNTAANLLLADLGGPAALTRFLRSIGDPATRLDRYEPAMSSSVPGDPRDTTRAQAMLADLETLLLGNALSVRSRQRLEGWMTACTTGTDCIRAGIPRGWQAGDKTGSGSHGTRNDIAILRPPGRAPILVTAYLTGSPASADARNAALAAVGRIVAEAFA